MLTDVPELNKAGNFSAQGGSFSVLRGITNNPTNKYKCVVMNPEMSKSVKFSEKLWSRPAVFYNDGLNFLTANFVFAEGRVTYAIYDLDGRQYDQLSVNADLLPSSTGRYFYTRFSMMRPSPPIVYDASLAVIKRFDDASIDWDAVMVDDSLYILRDSQKLFVYLLPDFTLQREIVFTLGTGAPLRELYCGESGTYCAISNFHSVALVNLLTGDTQTVSPSFTQAVTFTPDASIVLLSSYRNGLLVVERFINENGDFVHAHPIEVDLARDIPDLKKAILYSFRTDGELLLVNFSYILTTYEIGEISTTSVVVDLQSKTSPSSPSFQVLPGPSWLTDLDSNSRIHTLSFDGDGTVSVRSIDSKGVSHE